MKKMMSLILLGCFTVSAFASTEVARIDEKHSDRSIVYVQNDAGDLEFKLMKKNQEIKTLKVLSVDSTEKEIKISSNSSSYNFKLFKSMSAASKRSYKWCFKNDGNDAFAEVTGGAYAYSGYIVLGVGVVGSVALCSTVPAVPFLVGVILSPVDGLITLGNKLVSTERKAARHFSNLMAGKDTVATSKVFNSLVIDIQKL